MSWDLHLFRSSISHIGRRVWRFILAIRFFVFQHHRHRHRVIETIECRPFVVLPDVFNPALFFSSSLLIKAALPQIRSGMNVLDLGTGSGAAAVHSAINGATVIGVDINPSAVSCCRINASLNGVADHVVAQKSDLFSTVSGHRFDLILFNPPYYVQEPDDGYDHSWNSTDIVQRFIDQFADHLTDEGHALVVVSTNAHHDFARLFSQTGISATSVLQRNLISETLTVYQVIREPDV